MSITLVTGFNDTGKTTWIAETIAETLKLNVKTDFKFGPNSCEIYVNKKQYLNIDEILIELDAWCIESDIRPLSKFSGIKSGVKHPFHINYPEKYLGHPSTYKKWINCLIDVSKEYDIYIETPSEHILNTIRLGVVSNQISHKDVKILFFRNIDDIVALELNEKADLSEWPEGFFDQAENDYLEILKFKQNK